MDDALRETLVSTLPSLCDAMDGLRFHTALERVWTAVSHCNRYIDESAPWKLRKESGKTGRFETVIYNLCESLRILSILIFPFMPKTAAAVRVQLGLPVAVEAGSLRDAGRFGLLKPGSEIGEVKPLFPKIE